MVKHDIGKIETQIKALQSVITSQSQTEDLEELYKIIHNPGWTTLPEYELVTGVIQSLTAQLRQAAELRAVLVNASRSIGKPQNV